MDAHKIEIRETTPASRKLGRAEARELLKPASRLLVAKGKKLDEFKLSKSTPTVAVDAMLGPTGNLRAPCLRVGKTILVGFSEDAYREVLL